MLLPAKAQQRLVQLLYFLPKLPQPLLANLSRCCTAGRISAGLAASMIRILHLRWVSGVLGRPGLSLTGGCVGSMVQKENTRGGNLLAPPDSI